LPDIRAARETDGAAIVAIYNHYISNTMVTFEETPLSAEELSTRVRDVQAAGLPWLVAEQDGAIVGYAYAGKWETRSGYRFTVESSVYVAPGRTGQGIGPALYQELLELLRQRHIKIVIGGIALPNAASVALHERFGFVKVAQFREVGVKFRRWMDVGYWQLTLDGPPGVADGSVDPESAPFGTR
jgi:phosphinothricin acetyltransferase